MHTKRRVYACFLLISLFFIYLHTVASVSTKYDAILLDDFHGEVSDPAKYAWIGVQANLFSSEYKREEKKDEN
jgi:hypothetical protein